jgi:septal ring factor EnvC (AmiA/AmiB activator)
MRLRITLLAASVIVLSGAVTSLALGSSPPTPRVAKLQREVATLQRQLTQVQTLALATAQQLQASHQAFDNLTERVAWLEARVDKLEHP